MNFFWQLVRELKEGEKRNNNWTLKFHILLERFSRSLNKLQTRVRHLLMHHSFWRISVQIKMLCVVMKIFSSTAQVKCLTLSQWAPETGRVWFICLRIERNLSFKNLLQFACTGRVRAKTSWGKHDSASRYFSDILSTWAMTYWKCHTTAVHCMIPKFA